MESRYLFRAKRIDTGKWEIGSLIALPNGKFEIANKCENPPDNDPMWGKCVITHEIAPSTICQCTGLVDKNGKLIWENDIVRHYNDEAHPESYCIGVVLWDDNYAGFYRTDNKYKDEKLRISSRCIYEVIGKRFDNPELLEV
jgi:uncharacterized phage protein (TIGR01671 family)